MTDHEEDLARSRFMLLNLARIGGLTMVLIGFAIHYGKIQAPEWAGYVLMAVGLVEFFFLPKFLARKWRSPGP